MNWKMIIKKTNRYIHLEIIIKIFNKIIHFKQNQMVIKKIWKRLFLKHLKLNRYKNLKVNLKKILKMISQLQEIE